ncbi:oxidoreductase (plasmid) [Halorientalis sp. IM1011]|uniref:Gfo/Idh/MocA family protein n=1 Tax=Halorientalis sp. IM1011 TaxID=1932360 RepID=UPI00097CC4E9|nr:Gfo/Idh/MocA family oxidoreductase [Halorientalis sp. IM1011]AQL44637.1 oxidoreductase [Halorientalis sp. IM1011]
MTGEQKPRRVGVVGVGSMGQNHARAYRELPDTKLMGVSDADASRARELAAEYDTTYRELPDLLSVCDAVSVAVPTAYHYEVARQCIEADVDVLVEKPFVEEIENGRRLVDYADERDVVLQVGHIERFNPAVQALLDLVSNLDVIAVDAHRLGPPVDRQIDESAVLDLMIHDIDVLLAMFDENVAHVDAVGNRDARYASANVRFESGVVGQLTASRITQEKVRELTVSATDCRVTLDYIDQCIEITRRSAPEYVREDGSVTHRHERVVEELSIENREPLKAELDAFVTASRTGEDPPVTGEDGIEALELTDTIERLAERSEEEPARPAVQ